LDKETIDLIDKPTFEKCQAELFPAESSVLPPGKRKVLSKVTGE
jgi:hypothetical protein